mmetsp:Transcript_1004/g.2238  ORF Transcript_1004/g.2238 Transcript_1004/m.2238 type:complete len:222 (-) Transcript_1004:3162-3827(-)
MSARSFTRPSTLASPPSAPWMVATSSLLRALARPTTRRCTPCSSGSQTRTGRSAGTARLASSCPCTPSSVTRPSPRSTTSSTHSTATCAAAPATDPSSTPSRPSAARVPNPSSPQRAPSLPTRIPPRSPSPSASCPHRTSRRASCLRAPRAPGSAPPLWVRCSRSSSSTPLSRWWQATASSRSSENSAGPRGRCSSAPRTLLSSTCLRSATRGSTLGRPRR